MSLYQVNSEIANFVFDIDENTGEWLNADAYAALELQRNELIENTGLFIKNITAEAAAIKVEEETLAKRRKTLEKKAAWLKQYLQDQLAGEKFETPRIAVSYRKNKSVEVSDEYSLANWLNENGYEELVAVKYSVGKTGLKELKTSGVDVPFVEIVEKTSIQIK